jgi:hypothetical protein
MYRPGITFTLALTLLCSPARADEEIAKYPYVQSIGNYYVKSVPSDSSGTKGTTRIYRVTDKNDEIVHTFDWYAPQLALQRTDKGILLVRHGNWPRGHQANNDELAIAFYLNGKLLRSYSTLDIAGKPDNIIPSKSHYTVIETHIGFRNVEGKMYAYDIKTTDGRTISFNIDTGEIIPANMPPASKSN